MEKDKKNKYPTHIIITMFVSGILIMMSIVLLMLSNHGKYDIGNPFYVVVSGMIGATLFCTSIAATKDWYEFQRKKKEKENVV